MVNEVIFTEIKVAFTRDITIPEYITFTLSDNPGALGLYTGLLFLAQNDYLAMYKTQKDMADFLGISKPTFIKYKRILINLGFIEERKDPNNNFRHSLIFVEPPIPDDVLKILTWVKKFYLGKKSLPAPNTKKVLDIARKISKNKALTKSEESLIRPYIYNNNPLFNINNNINNNISNTSNNKTKAPKKQKERFPRGWYEKVLDAYEKYKGIKIAGPERTQASHAIRNAFLSGHKPKDLIDFMEWLSKNEDNPQLPWVKNWILNTVQKKMPEWKAGKLNKIVESWEDEFDD